MRFLIPFLGRTKDHFLEQGIEHYRKRVHHFIACECPVLRPRLPANPSDEQIRRHEGALLLERSAGAWMRIALDPRGKGVDSPGLAGMLSDWQLRGAGTIFFCIGGPLGLDHQIPESAGLTLSLSPLTFTHDMTRLILLEQLYRACTINAGHQYHK